MPVHNQKRISRRAAIAGGLSFCTFLPTRPIKAKQAERPAPVDLGHGLEIRDYRLFPTKEVMRFIVEIHNTTDAAVDTPTVGVELPHLSGENFGWANPFAGIIHPHSSQGLLGVAPMALHTDSYWGAPKWILCDDVRTEVAEDIQDLHIEITSEFIILDADRATSHLAITNRGHSPTMRFSVQVLVWDRDGRLCGAGEDAPISVLAVGESREAWARVNPDLNYMANPFAIIDSVAHLKTDHSLQPPANDINHGCPGIIQSI